MTEAVTDQFTVFDMRLGMGAASLMRGGAFAFGGGTSPYWGGLGKLFLGGVTPDSMAATFTLGLWVAGTRRPGGAEAHGIFLFQPSEANREHTHP